MINVAPLRLPTKCKGQICDTSLEVTLLFDPGTQLVDIQPPLRNVKGEKKKTKENLLCPTSKLLVSTAGLTA